MRKRRSNLEILADVLSACTEPIMKTDLMYKVKVTSSKLNNILDQVIQHDLLALSGVNYHITERGLQFIKDWEHLLDYFKKEEN